MATPKASLGKLMKQDEDSSPTGANTSRIYVKQSGARVYWAVGNTSLKSYFGRGSHSTVTQAELFL